MIVLFSSKTNPEELPSRKVEALASVCLATGSDLSISFDYDGKAANIFVMASEHASGKIRSCFRMLGLPAEEL